MDSLHAEITLGLLTLTVVSVEILNLSDSNLPINDLSSIPLTYCSTHKTRLYCQKPVHALCIASFVRLICSMKCDLFTDRLLSTYVHFEIHNETKSRPKQCSFYKWRLICDKRGVTKFITLWRQSKQMRKKQNSYF